MKLFLAANIIGVTDVEVAKDWYASIFGMTLVELKLPYFCEMKFGEQHFLLEKQSGERAIAFQEIPTGVRVSAIIGTDDIHAFIKMLHEKGVPIIQEPVQQEWGGWNAIIADPDGNEFIIDEDEW